MQNEMAILRRINGCPFVPEMVGADKSGRKLYTTYQGKNINAYTRRFLFFFGVIAWLCARTLWVYWRKTELWLIVLLQPKSRKKSRRNYKF